VSRILVVDDDPDIREILALVLGAEGHDVISAADGAEALAILVRATQGLSPEISLVVLDLMMPIMSGAQLVGHMRTIAALAHVQVVVLSGDVRGADIARELGIATYLVKPVDLITLMRAVRDALSRTAAGETEASRLMR
jgi:DNA-binding response OmpR family regulator